MPLKDLLFNFQGRARRSQWWAVQLSVLGIAVVLFVLVALIGAALGNASADHGKETTGLIAILVGIVAFPLAAWINLATGVKRLHDQDLSGWLMLVTFLPYIGGLFGLVCLGCLDGKPYANKYGPSPKFPDLVATTFS